MLLRLKQLANEACIRSIDYQFARFMYSLYPDTLLALVSALVSYQLGKGHVCLAFNAIKKKHLFEQNSSISQKIIHDTGIPFASWEQHLSTLPTIGDGHSPTPLVLDKHRIYLYRYWQYEQQVAHFIKGRSKIEVDHDAVRLILDRLFQRNYNSLWQQCRKLDHDKTLQTTLIKWLDIEEPDSLNWTKILIKLSQATQASDLKFLDKLVPQKQCLNWQKTAAALASTQRFSVISGGPGTGKTTTVTRLLALLVELGIYENNALNIRLVAPTGKAATRLTESIGGARDQLNCDHSVKTKIAIEASTLHQLLGVIPHSNSFMHNRYNKLHIDILVVDEASMIDLPMMSRLLEALPDHTRLILLGDRDQLASVEAGGVLGDICEAAHGGYSLEHIQLMEKLTGFNLSAYRLPKATPIHNTLCVLQKSYRFDITSGIGQLANAVNTGNPKEVERTFSRGFTDISWQGTDDLSYKKLIHICTKGYQDYLSLIKEQASKREILKKFNRFQLLSAQRQGRFGILNLNEAIRKSLVRCGSIEESKLWYEGRPVLITCNDHDLCLYNGDIGIALHNENKLLKIIFEMPDGSLRSFLPSRLPDHETVFAMTIHKSQGSEFDHTVIALPEKFNPIITRELMYTGITRAKKHLDIFCEKALLLRAIHTPTKRISGLKDRL